jgi:hypothetical protein
VHLCCISAKFGSCLILLKIAYNIPLLLVDAIAQLLLTFRSAFTPAAEKKKLVVHAEVCGYNGGQYSQKIEHIRILNILHL